MICKMYCIQSLGKLILPPHCQVGYFCLVTTKRPLNTFLSAPSNESGLSEEAWVEYPGILKIHSGKLQKECAMLACENKAL